MDEFDYVVVGAGSAGCVLAARLSEDADVAVAVVEAGGPDDHPDVAVPLGALELIGSELDWNLTTVAQPGAAGRALAWPRGRVLGGCSSTNFQMWVPGHADDFAAWGEGWSWAEVEPWFRRAEGWAGAAAEGEGLGTGGPLRLSPQRDPDPSTARFLSACAEAGVGPASGGAGSPDNSGCAMVAVTQHGGRRWSAVDGYLRPALDRPGLSVFTGTTVHRVLIEDGRATGVRLADRTLRARREVILSAGAVGSPDLLLRSGIGAPDAVRPSGADVVVALPEVGRGLQDHLILDLAVHAWDATRFLDTGGEAARRRWARDRTGPLTSNIGEAVAFARTGAGPGPPDVELIWSPMAFADDGTPVPGYTLGVVLLRPASRGTVAPSGPDPAAAPRIDPGYLTDPADVHTLVAGVRLAERVLAAPALRRLHDGPVAPWPAADDGLACYVRDRVQTVFHPVGTCGIGAVVDPMLRVRGVAGLRVADASVIPVAPRGHTHAHAVLVAERCAAFLRGVSDHRTTSELPRSGPDYGRSWNLPKRWRKSDEYLC